ncbi:MAG: preprotein translocase subunit SecY [Candidatus ainarchaeum sp.]|nr:preprotein translocase subunit SecY [Candidatus ainarchaeum sp.]
MGLTDILINLSQFLPEIKKPTKEVPFKQKLIWTTLALIIFFVLGQITLIGLDTSRPIVQELLLAQTVLASGIGTLITTGIGPIVMASIFLQLFVGAKILNIDLGAPDGRARFQALQKIFAVLLCFVEGAIYVLSGLLVPLPGFLPILILQIAIGSLILLYLDELVSKYGIGSGISLFIAGGVCLGIFWQAFAPVSATGAAVAGQQIGLVWNVLANGDFTLLLPLVGVLVIFLAVVFAEGMHVNIPITMGHKGTGGRYPIKFLYVSNMPVILAMALFMNISLWYMFLKDIPVVGYILSVLSWITKTPRIENQSVLMGFLIHFGNWSVIIPGLLQAILFIVLLIVVCVLFGWFWVQVGNQSTEAVAAQLSKAGMQIPGFRKDERVIEKVLLKYIPPITILSSIFVALLAGFGDLVLSGLTSGTGILLTVGIVYRLYEEIIKSNFEALLPFLGKLK